MHDYGLLENACLPVIFFLNSTNPCLDTLFPNNYQTRKCICFSFSDYPEMRSLQCRRIFGAGALNNPSLPCVILGEEAREG